MNVVYFLQTDNVDFSFPSKQARLCGYLPEILANSHTKCILSVAKWQIGVSFPFGWTIFIMVVYPKSWSII